ncbi:MAG: rhodanese-like domain-containing protein [Longimicrobiales bacterium]
MTAISLLAACSAQSTTPAASLGVPVIVEGGEYTNVIPTQLVEMLKSKDFFFGNTHIPYDGEIESTDAFIPYDETAQRLSEYPADKNAKIVLYCRSGRMSATMAQELVKAGYTNVWNLDGGMIAWEKVGLPLKGR